MKKKYNNKNSVVLCSCCSCIIDDNMSEMAKRIHSTFQKQKKKWFCIKCDHDAYMEQLQYMKEEELNRRLSEQQENSSDIVDASDIGLDDMKIDED